MNAAEIKAAARKALIAADPHYYSWALEEQELCRATMSEEAQSRVDAVLLTDLLGISCTAENATDIWNDLPLSKLNPLNWAKLLTRGIGEDMMYLNESMAHNTSLLDFNTLHDYDFNDHLFQEKVNKRDFRDYQGRDYYAFPFPRWARLIIEEQFYYATLYSLASYLTYQLEDKGSDVIDALIPHEYVEGKSHGKQEKGGFLWDMQIDAGGQEKQLDELKVRWYEYTQQRWLELSQSFAQEPPTVYLEDTEQDGDPHKNFIFNNEATLKQVRWKHFLQDCQPLKAGFAAVTDLEQQETEKAEQWLQESYHDIMQNFDPDVIKLRKRKDCGGAGGV